MLSRIFNWNDREFYKKIWMIGVPIALQNLINFGVSMMDTLMVGKLGEVELSAASAANQTTFMFIVLAFGTANGCSVLTAQYWGSKQREKLCSVIGVMYRVIMALSIVFFVIGFFFPRWAIGLFIPDAAVIETGVIYLKIIAVSFLFVGITDSTIGILRSVGAVKISILIYSVSLVTNTFLNYCLIFGKFGFPRLEMAGAAIATLICRMIETALALTYLFKFEKRVAPKFLELWHFDREVAKTAVRYASPVLLNETIWSAGALIIAAIIGHMGREVLAANSICQVLIQLSHGVLFGLSNSAATITGHTIGAGDYALARRRADAFIGVGVVMGVFCSVVLFFARYPLIGFYTGSLSPLAISYAYEMSLVASGMVFLQTISMVCMMGVLRGGGDTKFAMFADIFFMWTISIPIGALCALVLRFPVGASYMVLKSEDVFKSVISAGRILRGNWLRDITK